MGVYGAIPGMEGLWVRGFARAEAERDLREAVEWWVLKVVIDHRPLPAFDGVSLGIVEEGAAGPVVVYPVAPPISARFIDLLDASTLPPRPRRPVTRHLAPLCRVLSPVQ